MGGDHQRPLNRHEVRRGDADPAAMTGFGHSASIAEAMATASSSVGAGLISDDIDVPITEACCRACGGAVLPACSPIATLALFTGFKMFIVSLSETNPALSPIITLDDVLMPFSTNMVSPGFVNCTTLLVVFPVSVTS
ncbi:MAG: hypothetical protein EBS76_10755 [Actinobacteria bacterium]|nr:hypothetical protein [Actinomycetota bacterium]